MPSNLRSKPIEGHVTDSAGNVLRNATIVIKQATPSGSAPIDTIHADDDGYFRSKPLPSGQYDIYESGVRVTRTIHVASQNPVQCFKAHRDNYDQTTIDNFTTLAEDHELSNFRAFIQIEPADIDVAVYGNNYPLFDRNITTDPDSALYNELYHLASYFVLSTDSRITTTRFDVEYYSPLTALSSQYRRIRWAGVPAIRVFPDSKLVVPLDCFSVVANLPKVLAPETADWNYPTETISFVGATNYYIVRGSVESFKSFVRLLAKGDIVRLTLQETGEAPDPIFWYGIVDGVNTSQGDDEILLELWPSSRFVSEEITAPGDFHIIRVAAYDGMFAGLLDIDEEANERFTVRENMSAQNGAAEFYNYNNRIIS